MEANSIDYTSEDKIMHILEKILQVKSCITLLQNAIDNDYNPPEISDIGNSLEMVYNQMESLVEDLNNYRNYIGINE